MRRLGKAQKDKGHSVSCPKFRFSLRCATLSTILLFLLIFIALYVREPFVRTFLGDVLVILWMFYCVSSVLRMAEAKLIALIVTFAFCVELSQYFRILEPLNIDSKLLKVILGSIYDPLDFVAYILGGLLCLIGRRNKSIFSNS